MAGKNYYFNFESPMLFTLSTDVSTSDNVKLWNQLMGCQVDYSNLEIITESHNPKKEYQ